ncbi:uncharacterized protein B0H18DRAFT_1105237 [Fomitopsis serialis]|uniref:uncharacterized protein n=1 Tax=Fomitopsis serialis TaxID=139415 RepID=UPI0020086FE3|nr:uncharacterized protein B0H18DRAFT_1105237 [Neoantrodia serialis]KAH9923600.1 hypothetical protein B0H18DRAFT_1105237 [Neoantrodia serialis]
MTLHNTGTDELHTGWYASLSRISNIATFKFFPISAFFGPGIHPIGPVLNHDCDVTVDPGAAEDRKDVPRGGKNRNDRKRSQTMSNRMKCLGVSYVDSSSATGGCRVTCRIGIREHSPIVPTLAFCALGYMGNLHGPLAVTVDKVLNDYIHGILQYAMVARVVTPDRRRRRAYPRCLLKDYEW